MIQKIKSSLEKSHFWKFIVFCFVGGTSALVSLITFNIFFKIFNFAIKTNLLFFGASISYVLSSIMGTIISIIYNFSMNRNITFSARHESIKKQAPRYLILYGITTLISFITSLIVLNLLGKENTINANIAVISGIIIAIPINFLGSLLWAFRKKLKEPIS